MATTSRDKAFYITVRPARRRKSPRGPSKTLTVHGQRLTANRILRLLTKAIHEDELRKAG